MDYINSDGGHLPPGAAGSVPTNLLAGFAALPDADRTDFRAIICPTHHTVPAEMPYAVVHLRDALPGDTAGVKDSTDYLFLLTATDPAVDTNWMNLLSGSTAPPEP